MLYIKKIQKHLDFLAKNIYKNLRALGLRLLRLHRIQLPAAPFRRLHPFRRQPERRRYPRNIATHLPGQYSATNHIFQVYSVM